MTQADIAVQLGRSHIQLYAIDESAPIRWRLLGGNNRELGRGIGEFPDRESCLIGIKHLQNVVAELEASLQRDELTNWAWLLGLGGVCVATSGYRYTRAVRCKQGLAHFIEAIENCGVGAGLALTHSRRWAAGHHSGGSAVKRGLS